MKKLAMITLALVVIGITSSALAEDVCFEVQGMKCAACSVTLKLAVRKLKGIQEVMVSMEKKNAVVRFDSKQTNSAAIKRAIDDVGYKAAAQECKNVED